MLYFLGGAEMLSAAVSLVAGMRKHARRAAGPSRMGVRGVGCLCLVCKLCVVEDGPSIWSCSENELGDDIRAGGARLFSAPGGAVTANHVAQDGHPCLWKGIRGQH